MSVARAGESWSPAERVALWVAGAPVDRPDIEPSDAPVIVELIDDHCLLGRAIARGLGMVETGGLGEMLVHRQLAMQELVEDQLVAVEELIAAAGPGAVAVLKGVATFGLTNEPSSLRTGDVDLVVAADVDIRTILGDLGYHQTRGPFMHERGEFGRGRVEIDLHDHYPVMHLPTGRSAAAATAEGRRPSAMGTTQAGILSGEELLRAARRCVAPALRALPVVEAEALVVIIATHSLMNYVNAWSISHREKVYVRLGELLDVELLTQGPSFSHLRFEQLVAEVGAGDAVEFVQHLGRLLLQRDLIPNSQAASRALPPRCLWWDTWTEVAPSTGALLRRNWYEMDRLLDEVGSRRLSNEATLAIDPDPADQEGVLVTSSDAPRLWCRLDDAGGNVLAVGARCSEPDAPVRLRVDGGDWSVEWSRTPDQALGSFSGNVRGDVDDSGEEVSLRVSIPEWASSQAFVGAAVCGPGVTPEATLVAVRWDGRS